MANNRICYITRNYRNISSAGNKAKTDNEDTLCKMGAVNLGIRCTHHNSKLLTFFLDLAGVIHYCFAVRKGDRILLQYPVKKYFAFLCKVAHMRGAKVITVIHDLGAFRRKRLTIQQENRRLSNADYIIASNANMRKWLLDNGMLRPVGELGLFDYKSDESVISPTPSATVSRPLSITYAGALNMRKNSFFQKFQELNLTFKTHIYGNHKGIPGIKTSNNFEFHGFTAAETFIRTAKGDFGLVWDGDSIDNCTGSFGEYLRYNSPHKASFYLRAGLPILVWRQAAIASIIEQEGIGISIGSLHDLNRILTEITDLQMQDMRANVQRVSKQLRTGGYIRKALDKAISTLNQ